MTNSAQARLSHAQSDQATQQARADVAYKAMICELTGTKCQGSSGVPGSGIRYEALRRNYLLATAELQAAKKEVADAQTALDTAYAGAAKANADVVRQAQDQARKELPGLFASRDQLQELLNRQAASGARELANNTGILAQLTALDRLDHRSNSARLAHWLVVLLIIMIQILPVLMKFLTSMGPPTLYDRIQEADDRVAYEDATSGHEATSRQVAIDSMIRNSVVEAVYGPPLANYDGWINVEIHRPATVDVTDEERRIIIESPGEFDLTVTISTDRVSPIAEPLVVSNGVDLPKVEFTVMVDSELAALRQAPITVTVDSSLPSGVARFTLNPRAGDGTPWLWVRVSQGRRTLQNIELSLDVAPQSIESSRDVAPVREPS